MHFRQPAFAYPLPAATTEASLSLPTKLVLAVLAVYCHWDALTPYGAPLWTYAYGAALISVALLALVCRRPANRPTISSAAMWGLGTLVVLGLLTIGQQTQLYPKYILGDIARFLFPMVFMLYGRHSPDLFEHPTSARVLLVVMFSAAALSPAFSFYLQPYVSLLGSVRVTDVGRYDPPHPMLIVLLWYNALTARGLPARLGALCLLLIAIALALFSQQRTNALLFVIIGGIVLFVEYRNLASRISAIGPLLATVAVAAVVCLAAFSFGQGARANERLNRILSYTRFSKLQGGSDESVEGRFREVEDVWHEFRLSRTMPWLWGMGHGATFTPVSSNPTPNLTASHHVHHIHIGVVQLWFRYGLVGVGLLVLFIASIGHTLLALHSRRYPVSIMTRIWTVALVGGLIAFLVFGTLQDPFLSLAMAGFFWRSPKPVSWQL